MPNCDLFTLCSGLVVVIVVLLLVVLVLLLSLLGKLVEVYDDCHSGYEGEPSERGVGVDDREEDEDAGKNVEPVEDVATTTVRTVQVIFVSLFQSCACGKRGIALRLNGVICHQCHYRRYNGT